MVYEDGTKKVYNKQVQAYSLSPIGILYSMHLLGNFRATEEFGYWHDYEITSIDRNQIRNLVREYSQTFPKVFGKSELFKKIVGKDFESLIIESFLHIFEEQRTGIPHENFLLNDYVLTTFYYKCRFKTIHELIAEQISLIFYIHLEEAIVNTLRNKIDEDPKFRNKDGTYKHRESLNQAREIWIQIMDEDRELKKWYDTFLKNATRAKREEYGEVYAYRKEVYSHWDFPSNKYP